MDLVCIAKKMNIRYDNTFIKDVSILSSLSNLNLIIYYFSIRSNPKRIGESSTSKSEEENLYLR